MLRGVGFGGGEARGGWRLLRRMWGVVGNRWLGGLYGAMGRVEGEAGAVARTGIVDGKEKAWVVPVEFASWQLLYTQGQVAG